MRILNKLARHKYAIIDTLEAGVVLTGFEVKAIRENRIDISQSFARVQNGEVFLKNAQIFSPQAGFPHGYNPNQDHKLLLHKGQISSLIGKLARPGVTLVPLSLYDSHNFIKIQLGIAQSKSKFDKRRALKEKAEQRTLEQELKKF